MTCRLMQRACATGVALALACAHAHAATPAKPAMPDVATDPAGAWQWQFDHGDYAQMWPGYDVLAKVGYTDVAVDADGCKANADALQQAIDKAPVSLALRRAAMLCAEAVGDDAAAERALVPLAALSKFALSGGADSPMGPPIRVLRHNDVYALVATMGLEYRYEYYQALHMQRTFPFFVAAWDPEKKVERHLRFDWVDSMMRTIRDPETRYPHYRTQLANAGVDANAKGNITAAVDYVAWRDSRMLPDPAARVERLRQGTVAGGVVSPHVWLIACAQNPALEKCGDGFVDAVLPMAERKFALPMTLLAYAYNEGVGLPRDAAAGKRLLDAADQRWERKGASVYYAVVWREAHPNTAYPADLRARIDSAASGGNESAKLLQVFDRITRDPKAPFSAAEVALLSTKAQNGTGFGLSLLSAGAKEQGAQDKALDYARRAAQAGSPDAQADVAWQLIYGADRTQRDDAEGEAMLVRAAHGASNWAGRQLATRAMVREDYAQAWNWLRDPGMNDDTDALMMIAALFIEEKKGVEGRKADGVNLLRELGAGGVAAANRTLALRLIEGNGLPKDVKEARRLLTIDADKGDHESQTQLGYQLLHGGFGAVDEAEGTKWMQRAIADRDAAGADGLAYWLFFTKATPEARKRALEIWRASMDFDAVGDGLANNYAWALCTIDDPTLRDGKTGLAATAKIDNPTIGEIDTIAACHAAAGDFAAAKAKQQEVIDLFAADLAAADKLRGGKPRDKDAQKQIDDQLATFRERLALYASGKDYRASKQ
ncbi:TPR domain containing protein [Lysobacter dokdonensis DS-58]|uniref:TPR domain containing protein n=1 Tax=Lysobacter dokdonensis DS-58 TaxID=1300345 RepID=A0A0A2WZK0_9GAMM|nr:sel1 repeat family protein [Lysobacter dokdonensis]KGQ18429.1 TPR domain containing protein [Lysobacter dokdonensis DS-58]